MFGALPVGRPGLRGRSGPTAAEERSRHRGRRPGGSVGRCEVGEDGEVSAEGWPGLLPPKTVTPSAQQNRIVGAELWACKSQFLGHDNQQIVCNH